MFALIDLLFGCMLPLKVLNYHNLFFQNEDLRITGRATIAAIPSRCWHVIITTVFRAVLIQCCLTGLGIVNRWELL